MKLRKNPGYDKFLTDAKMDFSEILTKEIRNLAQDQGDMESKCT